MPFDPNHPSHHEATNEYGGTGDLQKNAKVIQHLGSKGFNACQVWYDGKKNPHIQSLDVGQLYIRGHGMAGDPTIEGGRRGERIDFTTVADRLISSGFKKAFSGEIHLYNCHSGESGDGAVSTDKRSFGQMFADHLYTRGFKSCKFYGYLGAVDSFAKQGSKGTELYSRGLVDHSGRTALHGTDHTQIARGGKVEIGTMEQARVGIRPTINMITPGQRIRAFFKRN
jgi:hypothetical protein